MNITYFDWFELLSKMTLTCWCCKFPYLKIWLPNLKFQNQMISFPMQNLIGHLLTTCFFLVNLNLKWLSPTYLVSMYQLPNNVKNIHQNLKNFKRVNNYLTKTSPSLITESYQLNFHSLEFDLNYLSSTSSELPNSWSKSIEDKDRNTI